MERGGLPFSYSPHRGIARRERGVCPDEARTMKALYWKISTCASLGAAAFFALRAPSGAPHHPGGSAVEHGATATSGGNGPAGWFGGLFATPAHAETSAKVSPLSKLKAARSAHAQCDALTELAEST